jgi:hypothetical protein
MESGGDFHGYIAMELFHVPVLVDYMELELRAAFAAGAAATAATGVSRCQPLCRFSPRSLCDTELNVAAAPLPR